MQSQWRLTAGRCVRGQDGFTLTSDRGRARLTSPEGFDGCSLRGTVDIEHGTAAIELGLADPRSARDGSCSVVIGKEGGVLMGPSGASTRFQVHQRPAAHFRIDVSGVLVRVWVDGVLASELMAPRPVAGFVRLGATHGQLSFSGLRIRYRRDDAVEVGHEAGFTVLSASLFLEPGQERELTFDYTLPASAVGDAAYALLVRKQAGTEAIPLEVEVTAPGRVVGGEAEGLAVSGGRASLRTDLRVDRSLCVRWR